jgi:hypothetical protein
VSRSQKIHYQDRATGVKTLCGRAVFLTTRVTADVTRVTCISCRTSPLLDGRLGNVTHTGH